jgi:hypothetical protein
MKRVIGTIVITALSCVGCSRDKSNIALSQFDVHSCALPKADPIKESGCNIDRVMKAFIGPKVRAFASSVNAIQSPGQIAAEPGEFTAAVGCGKQAVPRLIPLLLDNDENIANAARLALEIITNKSFGNSPYIVPRTEASREVAKQYRDWWEKNEEKSITDWLIADLNGNEKVARRAISKLGDLGDKSAIPALRSILPNSRLRADAALALARLGDAQAVPILIDDFLASESEPLRKTGFCHLYQLTGETFDYDPASTPKARTTSITNWRNWAIKHVH